MTDIKQEAPAPPAQSPKRWWALPVVSLAQLMVVLDATIVNIALPSAQQDLGMSDADRHWVITAYALAFGGLLLVGGRVCGALGHRRSFTLSLIGFAVTSALGGAANSAGMLFAARAGQGVFAALLAPAALSLLILTFTDGRERGKAFGVFAGVGAGGAALGVVAGGLLTEYTDWRWCLYINVPMAALALLGVPFIIRDRPSGTLRHLDLPGVLLSVAGLVCLVYGFTQAEPHGWGDPKVLSLLIGGIVLLGLFVLVEARTGHPLLPLRILAHRTRGVAFVSVCVMFIAMFGFYLFVSYYTQTILGYSPVKAGMTLLVNAVCTTIGAMLIAGKLTGRVPANVLIAGSLLSSALGMLILTQLEVDSSNVFLVYLTPAMILTGLGLGCLLAAATNMATVELGHAEAGVASAAYNTVQQVGAAFGTALLNSIATSVTGDYLKEHGAGPESVNAGTVHGYTVALWVAFGILLAGAVAVALFSRRRDSEGRPEAVLESTH
ncbi:MFS transporter [Streptomyces albus subsp. chlorinus]|uniref:MFS transporter n=1 Tax=Streptomyces albus subsp. chlorinus TaxID=337066 RepID=A0A3G4YJL1_9ACTN|nr:MFS transporter [Streptomyces albus subsp. chlorinus]UZN59874.1 MFS transporter [Streptomyces albus subsp. chlorinus] [Streptomyces sp. GBA 94-10 4N24]UZQ37611.1 MFS transporter [Streptomyces albus subsp. chlorinus] [Streptomyces sp. Je 1-4 4N24]UZQ45028.1 MFS transporter [Streptomyces albus subsp. chlorinus] [Streptomyces sp. Je 1-4 4N24_ara]WAE19987.1 MFS transporter [Streptomyces albus subsp. chlorinus] [Streptomyces albidoflavus]